MAPELAYRPEGTTLPLTVTATSPLFALYWILPCSKVDTS